MTLISYISVPVQTTHGWKNLRFDFVTNSILANGSELIDIDEVIGDLHHFEEGGCDDEFEDMNLEEEMIKYLGNQLVICSNPDCGCEESCQGEKSES